MVQVSIQRGEPATQAIAVGPLVGGPGGLTIQAPPPRAPLPVRPPPTAAPPMSPEVDAEDLTRAMHDFANPSKVKPQSPSLSEASDMESDEPESEVSASLGFDDEYASPDPVFAPKPPMEKPSPGFLTIEDEKADIMFKLQRLRKNGIASGRNWSMNSDVREMRSELARIKTELELERSLKFSRKALVGIASALEFFNDRVDILDLELDGWSEHMHQTVYNDKEYDDVLEELFFKYRGSLKTPPEVRLLLAVGGSAFSFHVANSMFKRPTAIQDMHAASEKPPPRKRPEMRGPNLAGLPGSGPPSFSPPNKPPVPTPGDGGFPGFSLPVRTNDPVPTREADVNPGPPLPKRPAAAMLDIEDDDESDRLSDVPSDLESVPSDMSSPEESPSPKRRRTAKKAPKAPVREKRVFEI